MRGRHRPPSLDANTGNGLHTFCDRAPCSNFLFTRVPGDTAAGRGRRAMDPVIIVGAGPVGLTLALALARQEVLCVVLDEGPGKDEPRLARSVVLREDTTTLIERLTGMPLGDAGTRWAGWRSMRRKQVMREVTFDDAAEDPENLGAPNPAPLHIAQHVLTGALRTALARRAARQDRRGEPSGRHRAGDLGRHGPHPRPEGHLVARQLRGRLRRPALHRPQAHGHPLPRPYGGRTTRRGRAARGTSVGGPGVAPSDAAVADVRSLGRGGHRTTAAGGGVAPGLAAAAGQGPGHT